MDNDFDKFEQTVGVEDETDLRPLRDIDIAAVSVTGNDWTTETILNQLSKGNIELNPRFQRRDAWEVSRKSSFIESLILGLPVPQIVLAEKKDERGKYIVLDGKQRLLCLRRFVSSPNDPYFEPFRLSNLTIRPDLNGKTFSDLVDDIEFRRDITSFENQSIRTVVVRNWKAESLLFHVFLRLNTGSKPLSPQELRQALHPGPFLDFADEASSQSRAIRHIFRLQHPDFRMRDVELIIRFFSFAHRLFTYRGNLKDFLDDSCEYFNSRWNELSGRFHFEVGELDISHGSVLRVFGPEFRYSKWIGDRFERRFNRAVFDIIIASFLNPDIRILTEIDPGPCLRAFRILCDTDKDFLDAIERTTKSLGAVRYRFLAWFEALSQAYGRRFVPPEIFHGI